MNPFLLFKAVRDLSALIEQYNSLAGPDRKLSLAFSNRSFIYACIGWAAGVALMFGVPLPIPVDLASETVYAFIMVGGMTAAGLERWFGKTLAVFNFRQAAKVIEADPKADALTAALKNAGAPVK